LHVEAVALADVLRDDLGEPVPERESVPVGPLLGLLAASDPPTRGEREVGDLLARSRLVQVRIAAGVPDEHDLVEVAGRGDLLGAGSSCPPRGAPRSTETEPSPVSDHPSRSLSSPPPCPVTGPRRLQGLAIGRSPRAGHGRRFSWNSPLRPAWSA